MTVEKLIQKLSEIEDKNSEVYIGCDWLGYCLCVRNNDRSVIFHDGKEEYDER